MPPVCHAHEMASFEFSDSRLTTGSLVLGVLDVLIFRRLPWLRRENLPNWWLLSASEKAQENSQSRGHAVTQSEVFIEAFLRKGRR